MALDLNRWFAYAKARAASTVDRGNRSLDRREAERAAELADKPWLGSDDDTPTFEEVRARIAWEAERQAGGDEERVDQDAGPSPSAAPPPSAAPAGRSPAVPEPTEPEPTEPVTHASGDRAPVESVATPAPSARAPQDVAVDAEHEGARLELERRQQAAADRLRAIRDELGVDHQDPSDP